MPAMTRPPLKNLALEDLIALAIDAGREILAVRAAGFDAQKKLDGSLVTLADQRAEAIIEAGLARLAPGVPMIGEEAVADGRIPDPGARFFCVDPLDGTRGFVNGGDEFTVNIALVEDGSPSMGVVFAPASGELYAGEPGRALGGREGALAPIKVSPRPPQWRIVASDFSGRNAATGDFIAKLNGVIAHASSSIKFCRLAEGAADLYPRFGDVCEWDAAAGHAVLRAAGGDIMDLKGAPLRYGRREDKFYIRSFVAFSGPAAASAARDALG